MEKGFYHPILGYLQTLSDPNDQARADYPRGTIEVDLQPSANHVFNGAAWQYVKLETEPEPEPEPVWEALELLAAELPKGKKDAVKALRVKDVKGKQNGV